MIYNYYGPRTDKGKPLSVYKYAKMSRKQVDLFYDFSERHMMHRVAKLLAQ